MAPEGDNGDSKTAVESSPAAAQDEADSGQKTRQPATEPAVVIDLEGPEVKIGRPPTTPTRVFRVIYTFAGPKRNGYKYYWLRM